MIFKKMNIKILKMLPLVIVISLWLVFVNGEDAATICLSEQKLQDYNETNLLQYFATNSTALNCWYGCIKSRDGTYHDGKIDIPQTVANMKEKVQDECVRGLVEKSIETCAGIIAKIKPDEPCLMFKIYSECMEEHVRSLMLNGEETTEEKEIVQDCEKELNLEATPAAATTNEILKMSCILEKSGVITSDLKVDPVKAKENVMEDIREECLKPSVEKAVDQCSEKFADKKFDDAIEAFLEYYMACIMNVDPLSTIQEAQFY